MNYRIVRTEFASGRAEYVVQCFRVEPSLDIDETTGPAGYWVAEGTPFDSLSKAEAHADLRKAAKKDAQMTQKTVVVTGKWT
jgi:hypothetical protein